MYLTSHSFQIPNSVLPKGATEFTLKIGPVNLGNQIYFSFQRCLKLLWKAQGTQCAIFFYRERLITCVHAEQCWGDFYDLKTHGFSFPRDMGR